MRAYEIIDGEEKISVGCLLYFEKSKSFIIELREELDEWTAPLLFADKVKHGTYTIGRDLSRAWVNERVIPLGRQNIDSILSNARMQSYDEMTLLDKASGRCSQDNMYIKRLSLIPPFVENRMRHNLVECVPCKGYSLLCFFADGMVRKVGLSGLLSGATNSDNAGNGAADMNVSNREDVGASAARINAFDIRKVMSNDEVFESGHIAAGGYCVTFNDSIDIDASLLYESGVEIPLSMDDFKSFLRLNIVDSSECCEILDCSRQNLMNYLSKDQLVPVKKNVKGNLYTKGNVYEIKG